MKQVDRWAYCFPQGGGWDSLQSPNVHYELHWIPSFLGTRKTFTSEIKLVEERFFFKETWFLSMKFEAFKLYLVKL